MFSFQMILTLFRPESRKGGGGTLAISENQDEMLQYEMVAKTKSIFREIQYFFGKL